MKHSFQHLMQDLRTAAQQGLIAVYISESTDKMTIRLPKNTSCRTQLTQYINKHYDVKAQFHGTFSIHVHRKD